MREQLLGYLLGALDPTEKRQVEERLEQDPELRRELAALREKLMPLAADDASPDPPSDLARRTCRFVMKRRGPTCDQFAGTCAWRAQDVAVAVGVMLAAALLVFPAVLASRSRAQIDACALKLHKLWTAHDTFSRAHAGFFPSVPLSGNRAGAGVYAPELRDAGLIADDDVLCPAAELAADAEFRVPTLAELTAATGDELHRLRGQMGGSYGYSLGYLDPRGEYRAVRNQGRHHFALMADAPGQHHAQASDNHGCSGQNVLFEDGSVKLLGTCVLETCGDHIFQNELGYVGPGIGPNDAVIGGSATQPVILHRVHVDDSVGP